MKHLTQKQRRAKLDREISAAKAKYREDFRDEHGYIFCEGCDKPEGQDYIDVSHSVGLGKTSALASDPENFALLCREICHRRVEAGDIKGMKCEAKLRRIIERHAPIALGKKEHEAAIKEIYRDNPAA